MAMFHFRLNSDKKPDGTKVSAVQHVDYIRREGNFANIEQWQENNKFSGNFISSAQTENILNGQNILLYKTDEFGSIRNSENGIEVTENFSLTRSPSLCSPTSTFLLPINLCNMNLIIKGRLLKMTEKNLSPTVELSLQNDQFPSTQMMNLVSWNNLQKTSIAMCDGIFQANEKNLQNGLPRKSLFAEMGEN